MLMLILSTNVGNDMYTVHNIKHSFRGLVNFEIAVRFSKMYKLSNTTFSVDFRFLYIIC